MIDFTGCFISIYVSLLEGKGLMGVTLGSMNVDIRVLDVGLDQLDVGWTTKSGLQGVTFEGGVHP
jgi:hypothetical protein